MVKLLLTIVSLACLTGKTDAGNSHAVIIESASGREANVCESEHGRVKAKVDRAGASHNTGIALIQKLVNGSYVDIYEIEMVADGVGYYEYPTWDSQTSSILIRPRGALAKRLAIPNVANGTDYTFDIAPKYGDINQDNVIDLTDYSLYALADGLNDEEEGYAEPLSSSGVTGQDCDLNEDGVVDLTDYMFIATNFNQLGDQ
jgi:hypothetical protein